MLHPIFTAHKSLIIVLYDIAKNLPWGTINTINLKILVNEEAVLTVF